MARKALARKGEVVSDPPTLGSIGITTGRLERLEDYRLELRRIYQALGKGLLTPEEATRLTWLVQQMRIAKREEVQMELMEKGGIAGVPFTGMVLIGPGGEE